MRRHTLIVGLIVAALASTSAFATEPSKRTRPHAGELGIWKSFSAKGLRGQFNNYDPVGLMAGDLIRTDCSINYTDADTHKTYCFNSATSQVYFANWPKAHAAKAAKAYQMLTKSIPTQ